MASDGVHGVEPADAHQVRAALRLVPMPVSVVLVRDALEVRGATVSSLMPVSLDPPTLAVSISAARWLHEALPDGAACSVNLLAAGQEPVADHYSSAPDRAGGVHTMRLDETPGGVPSCRDSHVIFECRVRSHERVGDHSVLLLTVCGVEVAESPDSEPLLWHTGAFAYLDR